MHAVVKPSKTPIFSIFILRDAYLSNAIVVYGFVALHFTDLNGTQRALFFLASKQAGW